MCYEFSNSVVSSPVLFINPVFICGVIKNFKNEYWLNNFQTNRDAINNGVVNTRKYLLILISVMI